MTVCKGVPQGSILGPLLFTLYLNYLVALLEYCFIHFYADDAILWAVGSTLLIALENLQSAFNIFQLSLISHKLVLNSSKTKCMLFSRSSKPDVIPCIVTLQKEQIEIVDTYKYLGFWLDSRLSFQTHVDNLVNSLKKKIGFLYRNKSCFSIYARNTLVQSLIMPVFDYGDILYMHAAQATLKPLDVVYHSVLRFILDCDFRTHHCDLYNAVGWPSLSSRREQHCLLFIFKAISGKLPLYLSSLVKHKIPLQQTRSASYITLQVTPRPADYRLGESAFLYYAPEKWNKLQASLKLKSLPSIHNFKTLLDIAFKDICTCSS